jgi:hypothetical protein
MRASAVPARALVAIALFSLAACGGSPSAYQTPPVQSAASQQAAQALGGAQPDKCVATGKMKAIPCKVKVTSSGAQTTISGPGVVSSTEAGCSGYATFHYFDYGIWNIAAGTTKGKCSAVFTGYTASNKKVGTVTVKVTNEV